MHFDPIMLKLVGSLLIVMSVVMAMRLLHQPHVVGYLIAGVLLGPQGLALLSEQETLTRIGDFGVVLLLFFVGMETTPLKLLKSWRITFLGTAVQIGGCVFLMSMVGWWLNWPLSRTVLIGFVISLSSTAVVLNYLRETNQLKAKIGQDALGILLAQDLALIPMLIVVGVMSGEKLDPQTLTLQICGAVLTLALLAWMTVGKHVHVPLGKKLRGDHELQVFFAFGLCLGLALLTGLFQLSSALGAFVAGMLVGVARETNWVHHRLEPFRVVFVAVFFVSIGMLVDVRFVMDNLILIVAMVAAVFFGNTVINATVLRVLGDPWRYSIYAGAHLAQIGEFSFVLAAVGVKNDLISGYAYQFAVAVIALSLALSPAWIGLIGRIQRRVIVREARSSSDSGSD
jgi:CPA2 family monovalent cation:H+ antiporter-2